MSEKTQKVVVLGASKNPERYSNKAILRLLENNHEVVPVHPALEEVEELKVTPSLAEVDEAVDTLTMYVSPKLSSKMTDAILELKPGRVIFNPGTENAELQTTLNEAGIPTLEACTLVLLATGQF